MIPDYVGSSDVSTSTLLRDNRETFDYSTGVGRCEKGKGHCDMRRSQEAANEADSARN